MARARPLWVLVSAAAALVLSASPLGAAEVGIHGRVPTICRASLEPAGDPFAAGGTVYFGRLSELCNNVAGYRLTLEHSAAPTGGLVIHAGRLIPIAAETTRTVLVDSRTPAVGVSDLAIFLPQASEGFALALRIEPRGQVF